MRPFFAVAVASSVLSLTFAFACSSSSSSSSTPASCISAPLACPTGETCWPITADPTFACITSSKSGEFGFPCENSLGVATCGDRLTCDEAAADGGTCTFYCDSQNACPTGYECHQTHAGNATGPVIQLCRAVGDDGGTLGINDNEGGTGVVPSDSGSSFDAAFDAPILQQ